MLANNDKIVFSLVNITGFNGGYLDYSCVLPNEIPDEILEKILAIDVFEYHEGKVHSGFVAFSIYVGKKGTVKDLIDQNVKIKIKPNLKISDITSPIIYSDNEEVKLIINNLKPNDIIVNNKEELKEVIRLLSSEIQNLKETITRVRNLSLK